MKKLVRAVSPVIFLAALVPSAAASMPATVNPLSFFQGTTEIVGTMKVLMHRPQRTRSIGRGQINPDGSLTLVQRVEHEGRPSYVRRWEIHKTAPGRFSGSMSEARGPVSVDQVGNRYRFRFKLKGDLLVEEWLTLLPGGQSATSSMTVRKFGVAVATSQSLIRRIS